MSATCLHLSLWCLCKLTYSEVFFIYEIANNFVKLLVARCVLVWSLQKTILTLFLCRLFESYKRAILNSLSHSHSSVPGPPSLQPSVQFLSLCRPLCLQTWTIAGEKVPSPASVQRPAVPEIPAGGRQISPPRYGACFHCSPHLLFF